MSCAAGTRPADGRTLTTPQALAGLRSEPPRSDPRPAGVIPLARAAASPPLDPPAVRSKDQGFLVSPYRLLSVDGRSAKSGRLVRPMGIAPAERSRSTTGASQGEIASASAGLPQVVGRPATSIHSLIVKGTPWSGPSGAPERTLLSASAAR